jgi:predicted dehydrogenase
MIGMLRGSGRDGPLRVGIVGTGFAATSHADALARLPGVRLFGLAGTSKDKAEAAAARLGAERGYADFRAMLDDPDVDAVHDCTPNYAHAEVNAAALAAGKHVLSEKPLAMDSSQTAELAEQAATARGVSGVCFNYRHYPLVAQARAMLAAGDIGPVHLVHGGYLQDWLLWEEDWNWRLEPGKAGATRAVGDIGSHWLDLVQHITGDQVTAVMADLFTVHTKRWRPAGAVHTFEHAPGAGDISAGRQQVGIDTEDAASVMLRFSSGARGSVTVSQVSAGWKNRLFLEIDGASGSLGWDQEEPNHLRVGRRDAPNADLPRDPSLLVPQAAALAHYPGGHQEGWPDALRNLFADFYAAAAARDRGETYQGSFATFGGAHQVALIVEAVLRSHHRGGWVSVGETADQGAGA